MHLFRRGVWAVGKGPRAYFFFSCYKEEPITCVLFRVPLKGSITNTRSVFSRAGVGCIFFTADGSLDVAGAGKAWVVACFACLPVYTKFPYEGLALVLILDGAGGIA